MPKTIGILAYGSLISDPGNEIESATTETIQNVQTPFNVEFARTSNGRAGAPTLVPVEEGGAQVNAWIFVVNVDEQEAANRLYRREINSVGDLTKTYSQPNQPGSNRVIVKFVNDLGGVGKVLYTHIGANIENRSADVLAMLAVDSAQKLSDGRDGISYLKKAMENGIKTPLSDAYARAILRRLEARDLGEAIAKARTRWRAR